jgi:hypothetical protein
MTPARAKWTGRANVEAAFGVVDDPVSVEEGLGSCVPEPEGVLGPELGVLGPELGVSVAGLTVSVGVGR